MIYRPPDRHNPQKYSSHRDSWHEIHIQVAKGTAIWNPQTFLTQTPVFYGLEQLIQKRDTIHRFINNTDFKHLITNMIDSFQLASGISTPVLENKQWKIKYVNSTWTTSLIQALQQYNIQLKTQSTFQLTNQRTNDSNIMENELNKNDELTKELKKFNACRMFYQKVGPS